MSTDWREFQVFVSSTFRDMHSEREQLAKVVFPELQERLETRYARCEDIDLRWGLTREDIESNRVVELCLSQVERCRPFFLCMLGERYGTLTDWSEQETAGTSQQRSITEIEVQRGGLDTSAGGRPVFLLRDPAFLDDVPRSLVEGFLADADESSRTKLEVLKDRIRGSGHPCFDGYPCEFAGFKLNWRLARELLSAGEIERLAQLTDGAFLFAEHLDLLPPEVAGNLFRFASLHLTGLEEFGAFVGHHLMAAFDAELERHECEPSTSAAGSSEEFQQRAFVQSLLRRHVPRERLRTDLLRKLEPSSPAICLVRGEAGSGKSSAMAVLAREASQIEGRIVLSHFAAAGPAASDTSLMLGRFCRLLAKEVSAQDPVPDDAAALPAYFQRLLWLVPEDRPLLVLVDDVDQLESTPAGALPWLPLKIPDHIQFFLSCSSASFAEALEEQGPATVHVGALTESESEQIVRDVPSMMAKSLDEATVRELVGSEAAANPQFLLTVLEELRFLGSKEQVESFVRNLPQGEGALRQLYLLIIERLQDDFRPQWIAALLESLACSRKGLKEDELVACVSQEPNADEGEVRVALRSLRPHLAYRGGLVRLVSESFKHAIADGHHRFATGVIERHRALAAFFRRGTDAERGLAPRAFSELPWHLELGQEFAELSSTLTRLEFLEEGCAAGKREDLAARCMSAAVALELQDEWSEAAPALRELFEGLTGNRALGERSETCYAILAPFLDAHGDAYSQACLEQWLLVQRKRGRNWFAVVDLGHGVARRLRHLPEPGACSAAFDGDDSELAVATISGWVRAWNVARAEVSCAVWLPTDDGEPLLYSKPSGGWICSSGSSVWSLSNDLQVEAKAETRGPVRAVAVDGEGRVAIAGPGGVEEFSAELEPLRCIVGFGPATSFHRCALGYQGPDLLVVTEGLGHHVVVLRLVPGKDSFGFGSLPWRVRRDLTRRSASPIAGGIGAIAVSPCAEEAAIAGNDGELRILGLPDGEEVARVRTTVVGAGRCVMTTEDIATRGRAGSFTLLRRHPLTVRESGTIEGTGFALDLTDGRLLALGGWGVEVRQLPKAVAPQESWILPQPVARLNCRNGRTVVACMDGSLHGFGHAAGEQRWSTAVHAGRVTTLRVKSEVVLSGGLDGDVVVCSSDGEEFARVQGAHHAAVTCSDCSEDGQLVLSGGRDGRVLVSEGRGLNGVRLIEGSVPIACCILASSNGEAWIANDAGELWHFEDVTSTSPTLVTQLAAAPVTMEVDPDWPHRVHLLLRNGAFASCRLDSGVEASSHFEVDGDLVDAELDLGSKKLAVATGAWIEVWCLRRSRRLATHPVVSDTASLTLLNDPWTVLVADDTARVYGLRLER